MSVVAVTVTGEQIQIGADSIRLRGWTQEKDRLAKLFQENGVTVGYSGWSAEGGLFHLFCQTHKPDAPNELSVIRFFSEFQEWHRKSAGDSNAKLDNSYFLIFEERVFLFHSFYVKEVSTFFAIGAGSDFALAALHLGHSVEEAVAVAIQLSAACEEPINIINIPRRKVQ